MSAVPTVAADIVAAVVGGLILTGVLSLIKSVRGLVRELADVSHEVHLNNGSSVKDVVLRLEDGYAEVLKMVKKMERRQRQTRERLDKYNEHVAA